MRAIAIALAAAIPSLVSAAEFTVAVGENGTLTFSPSSLMAVPGDEVNFVFNPKNHSVTQSTFADPCDKNGTVDSGFMATSAGAQSPTFKVNVTSAAPMWFHCAQTMPANHCQKGMVFAINPTENKTFAAFQATAMGNSTGSSTNSSSGSSGEGSSGGSSGGGGGYGGGGGSKSSGTVRLGADMALLLSVILGMTTFATWYH